MAYTKGMKKIRYRPAKKVFGPKAKRAINKIAKKAILKKIEPMYFDTAISATGIDYNGSVYSLSVIPQGDTQSERTGDELELTSIKLKYTWQVADTYNVVRILLAQWKDNTSSYAPVVGTFLDNTYSASVNLVNAPTNFENRANFHILYDKTHVLSSVGNYGVNKTALIRRTFKRKIIYDNGGTDGTNKIFLIVCSDSSAVSHPNINFVARIFYRDA